MEKNMLKCDICGGTLKMQANREAVCESCGMAYSVESLKEKFDGLKVSVTGSSSDVEQWKTLVQTYLNRHDFTAAEGTVKKILEAAPSDEYANNTYSLLQEWKYLEIVNGTLIRYSGRAHDLILPEGIQTIGESAFKDSKIHGITLPKSIVSIEENAFAGCRNLKDIMLPHGLVKIGGRAFERCDSLKEIIIPKSVVQIGNCAFKDCIAIESIDVSSVENIEGGCFWGCRALRQVALPRDIESVPDLLFESTALGQITIPPKAKRIGGHAFQNCQSLQSIHLPDGLECIDAGAFSLCRTLEQIAIPSTVKTIGLSAFAGCSKLTRIDISQALLNKLYHEYTTRDPEFPYYDPLAGVPWWNEYIEQKKRENLRNVNVCQYCGGQFKGVFTKVCSRCGKTKDY